MRDFSILKTRFARSGHTTLDGPNPLGQGNHRLGSHFSAALAFARPVVKLINYVDRGVILVYGAAWIRYYLFGWARIYDHF